MKKINSLLTGLLLTASVFLTQQAAAQAPQKMSYQSVIRNSSNVLVASTPVGMQISVLQGNENGTAVFVETQTATTNVNGLVSIEIGTGSATTGTFSEIDWATGPYFIKTEIDPTGGSNYTITGTQQMASVPYALYAAKSGGTVFETTADDANAIHNTNAGHVGIGTDLPSQKLDVAGNLRVRGNVGIGTEIPTTSAALEIKSTTGSLLIPRMTTAERNNLTAAEGMIIYNTSTSSYQGISKIVTNAAPVVDQSTLISQYSINVYNTAGQTFRAGLSGALTGVLLRYGSGFDTSGTFYIRDGAGRSGPILYQSAIDIPVSALQNRNINISGVNVIAGNLYTIYIEAGEFLIDVSENANFGSLIVDDIEYVNWNWYFSTTVTPSPTSSLQWENFSNGSTAVPGATGPAGPQGLTGATGPAGSSSFATTAADETAIYNTNAGNVGIGTDLPSQKLDVAGNLRVRGNVGIGTESPNTSAALEIKSTTGSLLIPRMTTAERNNLTAAEGMIIYNTSTSSYQGMSKIVTNPAPVVDQSTLISETEWVAAYASQVGQSFRAGLSGALTGVLLRYGSNSNRSGTFYIRDGAGNSGTILYQSAIDIPESAIQNRNINISGVNVIAGNVYTICIEADIFLIDITENAEFGSLFDGATEYVDYDWYFSTTVTPPPTSSLQWENFSNGSTAVPGATGPAGPQGPAGSNATVTLAAIGTSSNANGATIAAGVLNLQPANASFGGVVTTAAQTFSGVKTFTGNVITNGNVIISNPTNTAINTSATATAANILTGYITSTTAAAVSITLPTATAIATAIGGTVANGTSLEFSVYNSGVTNAVTLVVGTGITVQTTPVITGSNSLVIAATAKMGRFRLVFTSATTAMLFRIY